MSDNTARRSVAERIHEFCSENYSVYVIFIEPALVVAYAWLVVPLGVAMVLYLTSRWVFGEENMHVLNTSRPLKVAIVWSWWTIGAVCVSNFYRSSLKELEQRIHGLEQPLNDEAVARTLEMFPSCSKESLEEDLARDLRRAQLTRLDRSPTLAVWCGIGALLLALRETAFILGWR
jgi:hypothetical protein